MAVTPSVLTALLSRLWQAAPPASVSTWWSFQSRCLACVQGGPYGQPRPARPSLPQTRSESRWACAMPATQGRPPKGSCYQDSGTCLSFSPALCLRACQNLPKIRPSLRVARIGFYCLSPESPDGLVTWPVRAETQWQPLYLHCGRHVVRPRVGLGTCVSCQKGHLSEER